MTRAQILPLHHDEQAWSGRVEDDALLRGRGRYTDDVVAAGAAAGVFVRSPHAHAVIREIDCAEAAKMPGVIAVITAGDFAAANLGSVTAAIPLPGATA